MEKSRVLVVEDESIIAMEIANSLKELGYLVVSIVDTGQKAIEVTRQEKPDVVLMDIRIKGEMDGMVAGEIIRTKFEVPIIFMTAYLDEERLEKAKLTMPFGYILKPVQERDLKITIQMALHVADSDAKRKAAEQELRESEKRYRILAEKLPLGVAIIKDNTYTYVNPVFVEICGYTLDDFRTAEEWRDLVYPDPQLRQEVIEAWIGDKKQIKVGTSRPRIFPIIHKDGSEKIIHFRPVKLESGEDIITYQDITDRVTAEQALKESEEKYRSLFEKSNNAVFLIDIKSGYYLDANESALKLTGRTLTELKKCTTKEVNPKGAEERLGQVLQQPQTHDFKEVVFVRPDKSERSALLSVVPISDNTVFGIAVDITERIQAKEEREKLIRELQESLENVKTLSGLLPICASCKKVRDDKGYWNQIESYIEKNTDALFSHGVCDECAEKLYGDSEWYRKRKKNGKIQ